MLVCNPRKIHSNMRSDFVLIPMTGIYFNEKPTSIGRTTLELHLRDTGIRDCLEQPVCERDDFWHVCRLNRATCAKKRRVLPKFSRGEISWDFLLPIHETATHRDIGIRALDVFLNHHLRTDP